MRNSGNHKRNGSPYAKKNIAWKWGFPNTQLPRLNYGVKSQTSTNALISQNRSKYRLRKYFRGNFGDSAEIKMDMPISEDGIKNAITSLANRESLSNNGVTAENLKQNQQWFIHITHILHRNCQISQSMPRQRRTGIMPPPTHPPTEDKMPHRTF